MYPFSIRFELLIAFSYTVWIVLANSLEQWTSQLFEWKILPSSQDFSSSPYLLSLSPFSVNLLSISPVCCSPSFHFSLAFCFCSLLSLLLSLSLPVFFVVEAIIHNTVECRNQNVQNPNDRSFEQIIVWILDIRFIWSFGFRTPH